MSVQVYAVLEPMRWLPERVDNPFVERRIAREAARQLAGGMDVERLVGLEQRRLEPAGSRRGRRGRVGVARTSPAPPVLADGGRAAADGGGATAGAGPEFITLRVRQLVLAPIPTVVAACLRTAKSVRPTRGAVPR